MAEDFTEEQFDDELSEDAEPVEPAKPNPAVPKEHRREPRREEQRREAAPEPRNRYNAFMMPTRIGVIDNETGQPLAEDGEIINLLLGLITKLLNDVDEIKKSL